MLMVEKRLYGTEDMSLFVSCKCNGGGMVRGFGWVGGGSGMPQVCGFSRWHS